MNQAARDFEPAAHPAGIGSDEILRAIANPHHVEQTLGALAPLPARHPVELAIDVDIFPSGEVEIGGHRLWNHADFFPHPGRMPRNILAGDVRLARGRRQQCSQHAHQRGLAGAIGAEETKHLAALDFEVDPFYSGEAAEALTEVFGRYCC